MEFNYQEEVKINQYKLDIEWRNQPNYVLKYNEARADAQLVVDQAKEALDILIAEKDLEIRDGSDKKPTETAISNLILLDPEVQQAKQKLLQDKHQLALLQAACSAFDNRRSALENLVKLFGMSYFSEPNADIEARGKLEEIGRKGVVEKLRKSLNGKSPKVDEDDEPLPQRSK